MRVSCLQENLAKGLAIVGRAVSARSTLPVLNNILLSTDNGRLRLAATNLEIGINCWIGAQVQEEGQITVPARLLTDLVNRMPAERIDMELTERTHALNLKCGSKETRNLFDGNIKGIDASEFPPVLTATPNGNVSLPLTGLRRLIEQVVFSAATDESRPMLTGVLVKFDGKEATLAATDGYRLSVRKATLGKKAGEPISVIIPARALSELSRIAGTFDEETEEEVEISVTPTRNQILFHLPTVDLVSQLIEANFPDYAKIIPSQKATRTVVKTDAFMQAVQRAQLFARDSANIVRLQIRPTEGALGDGQIAPGTLTLSATSSELGDSVNQVDAMVEGPPGEIAFNARFLIDVLGVVNSPDVALETTQPSRPGVVRPTGTDDFIHVIMPMHTQR